MNARTLHTDTASSEPEVLPLVERGYTFRRKVAIGLWLVTFISVTALTFVLFRLMDEGFDFFAHVQVQFMTNTAWGHRDLAFNIPILEPVRAILFALSVICGIMTLLKLFIPPPVRTRSVVIHHFPPKHKQN